VLRPWLQILALLAGCDTVFQVGHVPPPGDAMIDAPILVGWKATATGSLHSCGIRADDTLWCWGSNEFDETGTTEPSPIVAAPVQVGTRLYKSVSSTQTHTCAIAIDDTLWCWGNNDFGQLGLGHDMSEPVPRQIAGTWKRISAGGYSTCAIRDDDSLWCWGYNYWGEVGNGVSMMQAPLPSRVGTAAWLEVAIGFYTTCGIQTDHSLWCWGNNANGTYGNGVLGGDSALPVLTGGETWNKIAVGVYEACGITTAGAMRCWGYSANGAVGDGTVVRRLSPTPVPIDGKDTLDWVQVSADHDFVCGIRGDGSLWCWGDGGHGQLGVDVAGFTMQPIQVPSPSGTWRRVDTGVLQTCAITGDDALYCFGSDGRGQLGDGPRSRNEPTQMPGAISLLSLGAYLSCGVNPAGAIACAGYNGSGAIGDLTHAPRKVMTPMASALSGWVRIASGNLHTCASNATATYCWGGNTYGQLGNGTRTESLTPIAAAGPLANMEASDHTCGLSGGAAYCWGYNAFGQIGNATTTDQLTAAQVPGIANAVDIAVGTWHTCVVIGGGTASCWGRGTEGEIGNGGNVSVSISTAVYTTVSGPLASIDAGTFYTCAIAETGRLWCWGGNTNGQLGLGDRSPRYVPTAVGVATWRQIALGDSHTCGIQNDSTLWCWGRNARGQLGIGTFTDRYLPAQVPGTGWLFVAAGGDRTCAAKAGGAFWCWGSNDHGGVPDDTGFQFTPVAVP
jgi:alpha-tubulin suppressor-like RCC1 family protein